MLCVGSSVGGLVRSSLALEWDSQQDGAAPPFLESGSARKKDANQTDARFVDKADDNTMNDFIDVKFSLYNTEISTRCHT
mmetsp:Transcript_4490/g.7672  ORF Transcript_4490/g.7672 Transcript_4490/m.7672 type:complete len:80 (+) Transcript_4490:1250-1489(+)